MVPSCSALTVTGPPDVELLHFLEVEPVQLLLLVTEAERAFQALGRTAEHERRVERRSTPPLESSLLLLSSSSSPPHPEAMRTSARSSTPTARPVGRSLTLLIGFPSIGCLRFRLDRDHAATRGASSGTNASTRAQRRGTVMRSMKPRNNSTATDNKRDEQRADEHARIVVADARAVDDEPTEAAAADVREQRRGRDDGDRARTDAGHDERRRERQLDAAHHLPAVHAHAPRGVADVGVDLGHADVRVREHGRDREQHRARGTRGSTRHRCASGTRADRRCRTRAPR